MTGIHQALASGDNTVLSATFQASTICTGQGTTTNTVTGAAIGVAANDRVVCVLFTNEGVVGALTSCTIGGINATKHVEILGTGVQAAAFSAIVPTGTTATIVITGTGNIWGEIHVWSLDSAPANTPNATATDTGNTTTTTATVTTTKSNNCILAAALDKKNTGSLSWTVLTALNLGHNVDTYSAAMLNSAPVGAVTPVVTIPGNEGNVLVVVMWER